MVIWRVWEKPNQFKMSVVGYREPYPGAVSRRESSGGGRRKLAGDIVVSIEFCLSTSANLARFNFIIPG
jgi:hypothetical protein